jgi:hypothetical protein
MVSACRISPRLSYIFHGLGLMLTEPVVYTTGLFNTKHFWRAQAVMALLRTTTVNIPQSP